MIFCYYYLMSDSEITKAFHYTKWNKLPDILGDEYTTNRERLGLLPHRGYAGQMGVGESAVYALLEPTPESWVSQPDHWNHLKWCTGPILLEIDLPTFLKTQIGIRATFIGDWNVAVSEGDNPEAAKRYQESFIPIEDYQEDPKKFLFSLPELQIKTHIPKEFIKVSEVQPHLEELIEIFLRELNGDVKNAAKLEKIKLNKWRDLCLKIFITHRDFIKEWWILVFKSSYLIKSYNPNSLVNSGYFCLACLSCSKNQSHSS